MIEMVTGKPGAGKSFWITREVVLTLPEGEWGVVGNLPLLLPKLYEYFMKSGRKWQDIFARVRLITDEETQEFWRFTPWYTILPGGSARDRREYEKYLAMKKRGDKMREVEVRRMNEFAVESVNALAWVSKQREDDPDLSPFPPVLQIIDEAHIAFDSRKWDDASDALTRINSQHRKLRWRIIFATQFLGLIDKRVKGFAEKFRVFKNMFGARKWNFIEMPKRMRELVYTVEPTPNAGPPDEEHWWSFDMEIAGCYDTMAGVGIAGGRKAEMRGTRGFKLPWWSVFVGLGVFVWAGAKLPEMAVNSVKDGFSKFTAPRLQPPTAEKKQAAGIRSTTKTPVLTQQSNASVTQPPNVERIYVTGVVMTKTRAKAMLSDGRVLQGKPGAWITSDYVLGPDGEQYWMKPHKPQPVATQAKPKKPL